MDEEQIKSFFASLSRPRKRSVSASKKVKTSLTGSAAAAGFAADNVPGLDYDDEENGIEKQEIEETLDDIQDQERNAAVEGIADDIEHALDTMDDDSEECPITVNGIDLCAITEQIQWAIGDPLSKLSAAETKSVIEKIEPDANKRRKSQRQLKIAICEFIKKNCECASFKGF